MQLVKVDPKEYNLEESKAVQIKSVFDPMLKGMVELEKEFNEIVKLDIDDDTIEQAKNLRLRYVKVRTGTAKVHKEMKAFYLSGGRFCDAIKNTQLMASQGIEEKLSDIENHYINIEKEKMKKLHDDRAAELGKFNVEDIPADLDKMPISVWTAFKHGIESSYQTIKDEEARIERERIEAEKAEKEKSKQLAIENEKLKKEAIERERLQKIEDDKREKEEKARIEKEAEEAAEREKQEKIKAEKQKKLDEAKEAEERKSREVVELQLKKEREEREAAQKIINDMEDAERQNEIERLEKIEADLRKGDEDKMNDFLNDLSGLKIKYSFKSGRNKTLFSQACQKIDEAINIIK